MIATTAAQCGWLRPLLSVDDCHRQSRRFSYAPLGAPHTRAGGGLRRAIPVADAQIALSHWRDRPAPVTACPGDQEEGLMRRSWIFALLALVASFAIVGTVLATHLPANHNITTAIARGTIASEFKYNVGDTKVQTKAPVDLVGAGV